MRHFQHALILLASISFFQIPNLSLASDIVGGNEVGTELQQTSRLANPVALVVVMEPTSRSICTGTLIAPSVVLTAAHCVKDMSTSARATVSFQLRNMNHPEAGASFFRVKKTLIHPLYRLRGSDDLALLLLYGEVPSQIQPASLPGEATSLSQFRMFTTVGYGQFDDHGVPLTKAGSGVGILRYGEFESRDVSQNLEDSPLFGMILADGTKTSICHGDSGGPLFAGNAQSRQNLLIGVNARVIVEHKGWEGTEYTAAANAGNLESFYVTHPMVRRCGGLNYFVDVKAHVAWIRQNLKSLASGQ